MTVSYTCQAAKHFSKTGHVTGLGARRLGTGGLLSPGWGTNLHHLPKISFRCVDPGPRKETETLSSASSESSQGNNERSPETGLHRFSLWHSLFQQSRTGLVLLSLHLTGTPHLPDMHASHITCTHVHTTHMYKHPCLYICTHHSCAYMHVCTTLTQHMCVRMNTCYSLLISHQSLACLCTCVVK